MVKYIAKRAAKNMSSLESQTIVPTATIFGRVILWCSLTLADVMDGIIPEKVDGYLLRGGSREPIPRVNEVKRVTSRRHRRDAIVGAYAY